MARFAGTMSQTSARRGSMVADNTPDGGESHCRAICNRQMLSTRFLKEMPAHPPVDMQKQIVMDFERI